MNRFPQPYSEGKLPNMREVVWRSGGDKKPKEPCQHYGVPYGWTCNCGVKVERPKPEVKP